MIIRNWKYQPPYDEIGYLSITRGQFMTGNILGVIIEKCPLSINKNNLADASTYSVPVRIKLIDSLVSNDSNIITQQIRDALQDLETEGCRAVITSGGRLGFFDNILHESSLLALSTPLVALDFTFTSIPSDKKVLIINDLTEDENIKLLENLGYNKNIINRCIFNFTKSKISDVTAIMWDKPYSYDNSLLFYNEEVPVYDILKLSRLITSAVMQIPYGGCI